LATSVGYIRGVAGIESGSPYGDENSTPMELGIGVMSLKFSGTPDDRKEASGGIHLLTIPDFGRDPSAGHYWTNIEVSAAFGFGARLGFNPGEMLDFLLGFAGLDLYSDDLSHRSASAATTR
jgi:hypothetical protein